MPQPISRAVIQILDRNHKTVGTGFIVSRNMAVTCAHVLKVSGVSPGDSLTIKLNFNKEEYIVQVVPDYWRPPSDEDVAFLRFQVQDHLPKEITPLLLGSSEGTQDHTFETFGYPRVDGVDAGLVGSGKILGMATVNNIDYLQLDSKDVTKGFSGSPIWDKVTHRVIGMTVSITPPDEFGRLGTTAFAIPSNSLRAICIDCPGIQFSDICPYQGLAAFTEENSQFFYGREKITASLIEYLKRNPRFLTIVGPSGCGKSSLVQAGLFPSLRGGEIPGSEDWDILMFRPGNDPYMGMTNIGLEISNTNSLKFAIRNYLDSRPRINRLVLFIDQFEELYAHCSEKIQTTFVNQLIDSLESNIKLTIILAIRADFYGQLIDYFGDYLDECQVNLRSMSSDEIKSAVEKPSSTLGLRFEQHLVETIVEEANTAEHSLPLLESALTQLWEKREQGMLTFKAFKKISGVSGAITQWAEDNYQGLTQDEQDFTKRIFTRLVHIGEGETADTRQRRSLSELIIWEYERDRIQTLIERLVKARLLVIWSERDDVKVEIIHDALLREWGRLKRWMTEQREFYLWRQRLDDRLNEWINKDHDEGALLHGELAAEAERYLRDKEDELSSNERSYINKSIELIKFEEEKKEKATARLRYLAIILIIALLLTMLVGFFAFSFWTRADETANINATIAAENASIAEAKDAIANTAQAANTKVAIERETAQVVAIDEQLARQTADAGGALASTKSAEANSSNVMVLSRAARQELDRNPDLALSQALQANKLAESPQPFAETILAEAAYASKTVRRFDGHDGWIWSVDVSPKDDIAVSGGADGLIILWDINTGNEIRRFSGHTDWVLSVAISPDGQMLLSGGRDSSVRLWDVQTGEEIQRFDGHTDEVRCVVFSPDGEKAISCSSDGNLILWDLKIDEPIRIFRSHEGWVWSAAFTPDGENIVSGGEDKNLILWNVETASKKLIFEGHTDEVHSVDIDRNGKTVLSGSADGTLILWNIDTGEKIRSFIGHEDWVWSVDLHPLYIGDESTYTEYPNVSRGDNIAVSSGADGVILVWDLDSGSVIQKFLGHKDEIHSAKFSEDGNMIISGSRDSSLRLWDIKVDDAIDETSQPFGKLSLAVHPEDRLIVAGADDGAIHSWLIINGYLSENSTLRQHNGGVSSLAFSPDGNLLISGSYDHTIKIWEITESDGRFNLLSTYEFLGHTAPVLSVAISPDGRTALSGSADKSMILWDLKEKTEIHRYEGHTNFITSVAYSPDGKTAISSSQDHSIILWDLENQSIIRRFEGDSGRVYDVAFNPDGQSFLSGSSEGKVILWDIESGKMIQQYCCHTGWVLSVAFNSDGRTALSGSTDGTIIQWMIESGRELQRYYLRNSWIWDLVTTTENDFALSASEYFNHNHTEGFVHTWELLSLDMDKVISQICNNQYIYQLSEDEQEKNQINLLESFCNQ